MDSTRAATVHGRAARCRRGSADQGAWARLGAVERLSHAVERRVAPRSEDVDRTYCVDRGDRAGGELPAKARPAVPLRTIGLQLRRIVDGVVYAPYKEPQPAIDPSYDGGCASKAVARADELPV